MSWHIQSAKGNLVPPWKCPPKLCPSKMKPFLSPSSLAAASLYSHTEGGGHLNFSAKASQRKWGKLVVPGEAQSTLSLSVLSVASERNLSPYLYMMCVYWLPRMLSIFLGQPMILSKPQRIITKLYIKFIITNLVFYLNEVTMDLDWEDFRFDS